MLRAQCARPPAASSQQPKVQMVRVVICAGGIVPNSELEVSAVLWGWCGDWRAGVLWVSDQREHWVLTCWGPHSPVCAKFMEGVKCDLGLKGREGRQCQEGVCGRGISTATERSGSSGSWTVYRLGRS